MTQPAIEGANPKWQLPLVEQTGLLKGTRCVSCRSYAVGFGGSTKHCHRLGKTVTPNCIACDDFDLRPGDTSELPYVEMGYLRDRLSALQSRAKRALQGAKERRRDAKKIARMKFIEENDEQGYIYFVDCGEYTKIGFSSYHPTANGGRIASISTSIPYTLHLWAFARGPIDLEKCLHKWFGAKRIKGEWFLLTHRDRRELARLSRRTMGYVNNSIPAKMKLRGNADV